MIKSRFLRHKPCHLCGSRDNRAVYLDGSEWCFGCSKGKPPSHYIPEEDYMEVKEKLVYPNRLSDTLPPENKAWLRKYGLTDEEIALFKYDPLDRRHIYQVADYGELVYYEARSIDKTPKCISHGEKPTHILNLLSDTICLVEDIVSAIRVSRFVSSMPLFGAHLHDPAKIAKLYGKAIVWLDYNKGDVAFKMAEQLEARGVVTSVVLTALDPKEHTHEEMSVVIEEELRFLTK